MTQYVVALGRPDRNRVRLSMIVVCRLKAALNARELEFIRQSVRGVSEMHLEIHGLNKYLSSVIDKDGGGTRVGELQSKFRNLVNCCYSMRLN